MKALLLRIGLDKGSGGGLSPIYKDGTFDFVPIPEEYETSEDRTFEEMTGRDDVSLARYLSSDYRQSAPHDDPEFETYTYGDPTRKRNQLARLREDDVLVFYAGLQPEDYDDHPRLFVVGYFTVEEVHDLEDISVERRKEKFDLFDKNAHIKREKTTPESRHPEHDSFPIIVEGKPDESRLLKRARPLSDAYVPRTNPQYRMLSNVASVTGYSEEKDLTRATGRWLSPPKQGRFRKWLDDGTVGLVEDQTTLRTYVLRHDTGFAPNLSCGYCTLATCKTDIRQNANVGDWVVGTGSRMKGDADERLLYAMRIEEVLTYDEYFEKPNFEHKKPIEGKLHDVDGDNIYYTEPLIGDEKYDSDDERTYYQIDLPTGGWAYTTDDTPFIQLDNPHHPPEKIPDDTPDSPQRQSVLIGRHFWYFGADKLHLPDDERLRKGIVIAYPGPDGKQGHENKTDQKRINEFVEWLVKTFRPGIHGHPRDRVQKKERDSHTDC